MIGQMVPDLAAAPSRSALSLSSPDVYIIADDPASVNTFLQICFRQNIQKREKPGRTFCLFCRLTNCVAGGIMEIRATPDVGGALKKKRGVLPLSVFLNLAGVDVEMVLAQVGIFGGVVVATLAIRKADVLFHERPDVLNRGAAIGAGASEPTIGGQLNHESTIAEQIDVVVIVNFHMSLSVRHVSELLDSHLSYLLFFFFL